jgi:hypothetical protein
MIASLYPIPTGTNGGTLLVDPHDDTCFITILALPKKLVLRTRKQSINRNSSSSLARMQGVGKEGSHKSINLSVLIFIGASHRQELHIKNIKKQVEPL